MITRNPQNVTTSIHTKTTSTGECLNFDNICPDRCKVGVITNFLHRAYEITSTWTIFTSELHRLQQLLINNNLPNTLIEKHFSKFLERKCNKAKGTGMQTQESTTDRRADARPTPLDPIEDERTDQLFEHGHDKNQSSEDAYGEGVNIVEEEEQIAEKRNNFSEGTSGDQSERQSTTNGTHPDLKIFFESQMTGSYNLTEKELRKIIAHNVRITDSNVELELLIYYRNRKVKSLFIKNNRNIT